MPSGDRDFMGRYRNIQTENDNFVNADVAYNTEYADVNSNAGLDISKVISACLRLWWVILLCAVILAGAGFAAAKATYKPAYSSSITFIASNTSSDNGPEKTVDDTTYSKTYYSSSDVDASQKLTNTFGEVLTCDDILNECISKLKISNMYSSAKTLRKCISVETAEDSQKLDLKVTTADPDVSFDVANEIMNNYDEILEKTLPNTSLKVLNKPVTATTPDSNSNTMIFSVCGFAVGLVLSVFIIVLKEFMDDTIVCVDDIKSKLGLRILGIVPEGNNSKKKKSNTKDFANRLIVGSDCEFSYRETFKAIRTRVIGLSDENKYKSFVVTSTIANEGKTTVSVNLALALSQAGKSVLLIDGDIRQPSIDRILGIKNDTKFGLTNVINGKAKLEDSIYYIENYNICVLLAGAPVSNPSEVLSSPEVKDILDTAKKDFDYMIIDSPPANLVTDSAVIGNYVDATILVARQKHARIVDVKYVIDDLDANGSNVIGCVFNGVNRKSTGHNRYYGYYGYDNKRSKSNFSNSRHTAKK